MPDKGQNDPEELEANIKPLDDPSIKTGMVFGFIGLVSLIAYLFVSGYNPDFICNSFAALAVVFALIIGLCAKYITGSSYIRGKLGISSAISIVFGAGGGVAAAFTAFSLIYFNPPENCPSPKPPSLKISHFNFLDDGNKIGTSHPFSLKNLETKPVARFDFGNPEKAIIPIQYLISNFSERPDGSIDLTISQKIESGDNLIKNDTLRIKSKTDWLSFSLPKKFGKKNILANFQGNYSKNSFPIVGIIGCFSKDNRPSGPSIVNITVHDAVTGQHAVYNQEFSTYIDSIDHQEAASSHSHCD